jgi:cytochrome c553
MIRTTALALIMAASLSVFAADEAKKPDLAKAKTIAETVCIACHGADGNSPTSANPILAGQGADYLYKQLSEFKAAEGKPAIRDNAIMAGMTAILSPEDMRSLAVYFSQQKPKPACRNRRKTGRRGQNPLAQGRFRARHPGVCRLPRPSRRWSLPAQYPRLAGQYAEYTVNQLKTFRSHERANDAESMMRVIAGKLSDPQINAVAEYAAGLR